MAETCDALVNYLDRRGQATKLVLWAHNSQLGDTRATEMGKHGELNVGQLVRERYGDQADLIGFTTFDATVTAATDWDGPAELKAVRPALQGSFEHIFHQTGTSQFLLNVRAAGEARAGLRVPRLERAIGVIYRPPKGVGPHC